MCALNLVSHIGANLHTVKVAGSCTGQGKVLKPVGVNRQLRRDKRWALRFGHLAQFSRVAVDIRWLKRASSTCLSWTLKNEAPKSSPFPNHILRPGPLHLLARSVNSREPHLETLSAICYEQWQNGELPTQSLMTPRCRANIIIVHAIKLSW